MKSGRELILDSTDLACNEQNVVRRPDKMTFKKVYVQEIRKKGEFLQGTRKK